MSRQQSSIRRRHAAQLFKTDMCKFFLEGRCENGDACSYAHEMTEVRSKPDLTRTSMCRRISNEGVCNDVSCRFAHSEEELRSTSGFFKMKMCVFAQSGKCKHGNRCRFAHAADELQPSVRLREEEAMMTAIQAVAEKNNGKDPNLACLGTPTPDQGSQGTTGSTITATGCGSISGQSSNEHSAEDSRGARPRNSMARSAWNERMERNENSDGSSWASGNSSVTVVPRSEHTGTGSPPATSDSSSSGAGGNGESTADGSTGNSTRNSASTENAKSARRHVRTSSGEQNGTQKVTTLLINNVPMYLTQGALLSMFEDLTTAMRGKFDFFYCPWDHKAGHNYGYAIINFTDAEHAAEFQHQWASKDLFRSGRGQKVLKVVKATVQGLQANLAYFRKKDFGRQCPDVRFRPLCRDTEGNLKPLELDRSLLEPPDLDTGQPGNRSATQGPRATGSPGNASESKSTSGASRSERERQEQHDRRRGTKLRRETEVLEKAPEVPMSEKFPLRALQQPLPPQPLPPGVQPQELRQLALQQQQQQLLQVMKEEENRRKQFEARRPPSTGATEGSMVQEVRQQLTNQQLQLMAMQMQVQSLQQVTGMSSGIAPDASFGQASRSNVVGQFLVSPVPTEARDCGQMAVHLANQVNPMMELGQAQALAFDGSHEGRSGLCSGAMGNSVQMVPYMMLPLQAMQMGDGYGPGPANGTWIVDEVYTD
ncbi:unnamed protein product [Effrenium voratum]|uniref:Uncharacterized protein n=1 Tax=Effrenium voratum TaxID=2562239 RepID=A0AA36JAE1_9DINO|nr:unnamed protein product [Effrenium voratum]